MNDNFQRIFCFVCVLILISRCASICTCRVKERSLIKKVKLISLIYFGIEMILIQVEIEIEIEEYVIWIYESKISQMNLKIIVDQVSMPRKGIFLNMESFRFDV